MDDLPPSPAQVPRHLLADPEFVRALHERDFTTVFATAHDAGTLAALTAARTDVDQTLSPDTPQDLADLEAAAEGYGYGYHGQAPTRVLANLVTDFTTLRPLLTVPQPALIRARLCRTAGQMAGMTAIVLHDLGSRQQSRAWFATAARAAAESGDDQLHAWVLSREAMVPLNYGAPRAAAELADQARLCRRHPAHRRGDAGGRRRRLCLLPHHQPEQARAALAAADALLNRLPESQRSDTSLTYSEQKHHVHLSHAYTTLGDTARAHSEPAARPGAVRADQHHDANTAAHRRRRVLPPRRRQRTSVPPYGRRPDRTARGLPHRPGAPPRPGPVRGDPHRAPPRARRTRLAGRPGRPNPRPHV
ncbi:hypothetical protein [Streptomyces coeruleorubidus]|uniref:hypothetical protein n=1 Tax=Streptomyces coeruleorubidus TaxID=116188 RepID=UPI00365EAEF6